MDILIRIDKVIYNEAKKIASKEGRTVSQQFEFWVMLGKCALDNPTLPITFIKDLLISKSQNKSISKPFKFKS